MLVRSGPYKGLEIVLVLMY